MAGWGVAVLKLGLGRLAATGCEGGVICFGGLDFDGICLTIETMMRQRRERVLV